MASGMSETQTMTSSQPKGMRMEQEQLVERVHALEVAQATQAATMAGAQTTQAAMQAGTWSTIVAGSTMLIAGLVLGALFRRH